MKRSGHRPAQQPKRVGVGVTLHVHKTEIRNCRAGGANGIVIQPSSGLANVTVDDSCITDNGSSLTDAGILVKRTGGAAST